MFPPTVLVQSTGVVLTTELQVSWPLLVAFAMVVAAWGEARVHISGLREWRREASVEIAALKKENADVKSRADLQGQQINHMLQMLTEMREDLKSLVRRGVA